MSSYTASDFYRDELRRLDDKKSNADSILTSQDRLAKLNEGYRKRYAKYVEILIVLILLYSLRLLALTLHKQFSVLPEIVVDVVTTLLILYAGYYLFNAYLELTTRSIINYDEINLPPYDSSGVDVSSLEESGRIFKQTGSDIDLCVGEECCPGNFDPIAKRCIVGVGNVMATSASISASPTATSASPTLSSVSGINLGGLGNISRQSIAGFTSLEQSILKNGVEVRPIDAISSLSYSKV